MSVTLIGESKGTPAPHPLTMRKGNDTNRATASLAVSQALEGTTSWEAAHKAVSAIVPINSAESDLLLQIIYAANNPQWLQRALLEYIRHLTYAEGLTACALYYAELAHVLTKEPTGDLLIELATLYRKQCRFVEAKDIWGDVERMGRQQENRWLVVRSHIGMGMATAKLGNLSGARQWFESALADAYTFPDLRAMALNNLGDVLAHLHPPEWIDAAMRFRDAAALYTDLTLKHSALLNLAVCAVGCRYYKLADVTLRRVIGTPSAPGSPCWADVTNAMIERLDVCSALQDWEGVTFIRTSLRWRLDRLTPDMKCDYHYRLGLIELRRGGNPSPDWNQAHWIASQHNLGEWMIRLEKLLETRPDPVEPVEELRLYEVWMDMDLQASLAGV
jgi:hypothetical protein